MSLGGKDVIYIFLEREKIPGEAGVLWGVAAAGCAKGFAGLMKGVYLSP